MERYLNKCISTLCNQTYNNIEIILVDDGSKDCSLEICNELKHQDNRIRVISKENAGVSSARNKGLEESKGEWIMFVDPDDYVTPFIVEKLVNEIDENIDIIACCCKVFDDSGLSDVDHFYNGNRTFNPKSKQELYFQLMQSNYGKAGKSYTAIGVPWGKLYRKKFLDRFNLKFDENLRRVQDNIFNMYAFNYANAVRYLDQPLYCYRYDHMSNYFKTFHKNYVDIFVAVRKARYKCLMDTGLYNNRFVLDYYLEETTRNLIGILKNGVFHKENKEPFDNKIMSANQICESECFACIFHGFRSQKFLYNLCIYLIKNKYYRLFNFLVNIK